MLTVSSMCCACCNVCPHAGHALQLYLLSAQNTIQLALICLETTKTFSKKQPAQASSQPFSYVSCSESFGCENPFFFWLKVV